MGSAAYLVLLSASRSELKTLPLLRPQPRHLLHQPLQRQPTRLPSLDDGLHDVRREKGETQDPSDAGSVHTERPDKFVMDSYRPL